MGSQASSLAFPLLILATTGSPAQAGLMGAIRGVPHILFGLAAGGLVDRWNRRRVMVLCDAGRALALGSIPVALALGRLTAVQLYAVSFLEGTLFIFFGLASTAALRAVVAPVQLPTAVAQGQATQAAAGLAGPALGGVIFGLGRALPFALDALSYAASVVALLGVRTPLDGDRDAARRPLRAEVVAGLRWLWAESMVRHLLWLHTGVNFLYGGWTLMLMQVALALLAVASGPLRREGRIGAGG